MNTSRDKIEEVVIKREANNIITLKKEVSLLLFP